MANVIRNMNFKPIIEKIEYNREGEPKPNDKINMRVWDEMKVERLRADAVKVVLQRNVEPEPKTIFSIQVAIGIEVLINTEEFDKLDDSVEFFKNSKIMECFSVCGDNFSVHKKIISRKNYFICLKNSSEINWEYFEFSLAASRTLGSPSEFSTTEIIPPISPNGSLLTFASNFT